MWSDLSRSSKMRLQGCRGQEGRRDAWSEGGALGRGGREIEGKRGQERERERDRERQREREKGGRPMACGVHGSPHGPVDVAARAVAGVCSTHLLKHRHRHRH